MQHLALMADLVTNGVEQPGTPWSEVVASLAAVLAVVVLAVVVGIVRHRLRDTVQLETDADRATRELAVEQQLALAVELDALDRLADAREQYRAAVRDWSTAAHAAAGSDQLAARQIDRLVAESVTSWPTAATIDRANAISERLLDRARQTRKESNQ